MSPDGHNEDDLPIFLFVAALGAGAVYAFWLVLHRFWYHFPEFLHFILR